MLSFLFILELYSLKTILKIHQSKAKPRRVIPIQTFSSTLSLRRLSFGRRAVFIEPYICFCLLPFPCNLVCREHFPILQPLHLNHLAIAFYL